MTLAVGGEDRKAARHTAKALTKTSVSDLQLLLSTRSQYGCLHALLADKPLLPEVKQLQLRFLLSNTPKHRTAFQVPESKQDLGRLEQIEDLQIQTQTYINNYTLQVSHSVHEGRCRGCCQAVAIVKSPTDRQNCRVQKPFLRQSGAASHITRACHRKAV